MNAVVSEHEGMRLLEGAKNGGVEDGSAVGGRLEALKELTMALLREVETLGEVQSSNTRRDINLHDEVRRFETDLIRRALMKTGGHQVRAARLLGMKVTTLNSKIKRYNIATDIIIV